MEIRPAAERDARPLVIIQPFGPIMFAYDLRGTEVAAVPEGLLKPFSTAEGLGAFWGFCRSCKGVFSKGGTKICHDDHGRDSLEFLVLSVEFGRSLAT